MKDIKKIREKQVLPDLKKIDSDEILPLSDRKFFCFSLITKNVYAIW
jgi:hypothetical protein